ncbi:MAG TPA: glycosyltransferase family 39 protein [Verrucomicrobiae bacterium]|nr:glycosyltransferase family 39 protein [Verrucomicrobiae bacterium]
MNAILQMVGRFRVALVLGTFAMVFVALSVSSYLQKSLAIDENGHVLEGYMALTRGYHIRTDHPPFLNELATLPLLIESVKFDPSNVPKDELTHAFFFGQNDCDKLLRWPRLIITLLGALLGVILFFWARDLFGFWPATAGLALYTCEPNFLCNAGVVTADLGLVCFFFGTVYFLCRTLRCLTPVNVAGLAIFFGIAHVSKFSGFLLGPILALLLAVRIVSRQPWPFRWRGDGKLQSLSLKSVASAALIIVVGIVFVLVVWMTYGFHYTTGSDVYGGGTSALYEDPVTRVWLPKSAMVLGWIDRHRLLPNAYTQNFLRQELSTTGNFKFAAFLLGQSKYGHWWYYFPVVFLVKTPLTVLCLFFAGGVLCLFRRRKMGMHALCILLPMALYLAVAMFSTRNIGVRHLLPIYPFVILVAVVPLAELLRRGMKWALACFCLLAWLEMASVYPHYRGFFNCLAGGPRNGPNILADSNIDWGQDLKLLKQWMTAHGVSHINLAYWGVSDAEYYGIDCTHMLTTMQSTYHPLMPPQVPGYVAVSVQLLHDPAFPQVAAYYSPLLEKTPVAMIGYSIYVYWVDQWW